MVKRNIKGTLEVICGSMFSGKSEELIRRIRRAEIAQQKVTVFKHRVDDRMSIEYIHTHNGDKCKAIAIDNPKNMELFVNDEVKVVGIDEVQFFAQEAVPHILSMVESGKRVIAAGLDLDFRGVPFGIMPSLMALADSIAKLNAVCIICGGDAHYSQRLINGRTAKFNDPVILVGSQDSYQARCRDCYVIDTPAWQQENEF